MTRTSGYAPVGDLRMYYRDHGSAGPPVVLLHGGVMTLDLTFGAIVPHLLAGRRVIGTELQGHGHTADTRREFTLADLADDVIGLLDHLGLERADLFGFSVGGLVALEVGVRHPGRVDRLVLASTQYRRDGYRDDLVPPSAHDFARMRAAHAAVNPHPDRFDAMMRKIGRVALHIPGWTDDELRGLTAPTLLVLGDDDFVRLEHAVRMHQLIPDARLAVLPGTTHLDIPHRERLIGPMAAEFLSRDDHRLTESATRADGIRDSR